MAKGKNWKENLKHLRIALDRMMTNYSVDSECTLEEAITVAEGVLASAKRKARKGQKSPYSLGPLDPTKTDSDDEREDPP